MLSDSKEQYFFLDFPCAHASDKVRNNIATTRCTFFYAVFHEALSLLLQESAFFYGG